MGLLPSALTVGLSVTLAVPVVPQTASAPSTPRAEAVFTPADKQGFCTAKPDPSC